MEVRKWVLHALICGEKQNLNHGVLEDMNELLSRIMSVFRMFQKHFFIGSAEIDRPINLFPWTAVVKPGPHGSWSSQLLWMSTFGTCIEICFPNIRNRQNNLLNHFLWHSFWQKPSVWLQTFWEGDKKGQIWREIFMKY